MTIQFLKPNYYSQVSERSGVQMGPDGNLEAGDSSTSEAKVGWGQQDLWDHGFTNVHRHHPSTFLLPRESWGLISGKGEHVYMNLVLTFRFYCD